MIVVCFTPLYSFFFKVLASSGVWCVVYFLGAIFFCSFYLLNLVLAVVALSYELEIKSVHKEVIPFFSFLHHGYNCISYLSVTRRLSDSPP